MSSGSRSCGQGASAAAPTLSVGQEERLGRRRGIGTCPENRVSDRKAIQLSPKRDTTPREGERATLSGGRSGPPWTCATPQWRLRCGEQSSHGAGRASSQSSGQRNLLYGSAVPILKYSLCE